MNFQISELHESNSDVLNELLELLARTQGRGVYSLAFLEDRVNSSESSVFVGKYNGRLVSVGCAELLNSLDYYLPFDENIKERLEGVKIGSLSTLSVHEEFQGRGIGQKVTKARLSWLKEKGCECVLGVSWVSGLLHTSKRVFEKLGFRYVNEVESFYREEAIKNPFDCPGCRVQPCECSAILFELKLIGEK